MIKRITFLLLVFISLTLNAEIKAPVKLSPKNQQFIQNLPENYRYGWIEVPEDYSKPNGRKIQVFYYGTKPGKNNSVPVVVFHGGPGGGSHQYFMALRYVAQDLNIIFMDERGTGASTPFPIARKENVNRYKHYLSEAIVKDAERLRKKLYGNKKWSIAGHSFGSLIVHRYISMFPKSIHTAHAHGWGLISNAKEYPELRLLAHKKALDEYLKKYPEDKKLIQQLTESLTDDDAITQGNLTIRGKSIAHFFSLLTFGFKNSWPMFHDYLHKQLVVGDEVDKEKFKSMASMMIFQYMNFGESAFVVNIVFNRLEAYETGKKSLSDFYNELFIKMEKEGNDVSKWPIGEEAMAHSGLESPVLNMIDKMDLGKFKHLRLKDVEMSLKKYQNLKLYLYSGELDTFSPPIIFQESANLGLDNLIYKNFKHSGHEGFMSEYEIWQTIISATKMKLPEIVK